MKFTEVSKVVVQIGYLYLKILVKDYIYVIVLATPLLSFRLMVFAQFSINYKHPVLVEVTKYLYIHSELRK